jgi:fatty acid desaturase
MKKNMGTADRVIRVALAVLVAVLYFTGTISGTLALVLGILAGVFVLTSFVSFCPLYVPVKLSTRKQ